MNIAVENIKCGGCANSITKKLSKIFNTDNIQINVDTGMVSIDIGEDQQCLLSEVLQELGYPKKDSVSGFSSTKARIKSFASCAIGKIEK
jgi:copper chaperone CopZ